MVAKLLRKNKLRLSKLHFSFSFDNPMPKRPYTTSGVIVYLKFSNYQILFFFLVKVSFDQSDLKQKAGNNVPAFMKRQYIMV